MPEVYFVLTLGMPCPLESDRQNGNLGDFAEMVKPASKGLGAFGNIPESSF